MNKYRAKKVVTEDGKFDSKAEYNRWLVLKAAATAGEITDLQRQVEYVLIPNQKLNGRVKERCVKYVADFVYRRNDVQIVEDVKGKRTKEYIIKRKLMLYVHGIAIYETR